MATPHRWIESAQSSMGAAVQLADGHPRSAASRAYFAAYAAIHAVLLALGERPPARGNWGHEGLAQLLHTVLARKPRRRRAAIKYRQVVQELLNARIRADYAPATAVDGFESVRRARLLVALAEGYLK